MSDHNTPAGEGRTIGVSKHRKQVIAHRDTLGYTTWTRQNHLETAMKLRGTVPLSLERLQGPVDRAQTVPLQFTVFNCSLVTVTKHAWQIPLGGAQRWQVTNMCTHLDFVIISSRNKERLVRVKVNSSDRA